MRTSKFSLLIILLVLVGASTASASPILSDWAFAISFSGGGSTGISMTSADSTLADATIPNAIASLGSNFQAGVYDAQSGTNNFDTTNGNRPTGLGNIVIGVTNTTDSTQDVTVVAWLKYTFSDNGAYGDTPGVSNASSFDPDPAGKGQSWAFGDYQYALDNGVYPTPLGDPFALNTSDPGLFTPWGVNYDNGGGQAGLPCCDVLVGIGRTRILTSGEYAEFAFLIRDSLYGFSPNPGTFYLSQTDGANPNETLYFTTPEPAGWVLILGGLLVFLGLMGRRARHASNADTKA
jgi:hypothetical protein